MTTGRINNTTSSKRSYKYHLILVWKKLNLYIAFLTCGGDVRRVREVRIWHKVRTRQGRCRSRVPPYFGTGGNCISWTSDHVRTLRLYVRSSCTPNTAFQKENAFDCTGLTSATSLGPAKNAGLFPCVVHPPTGDLGGVRERLKEMNCQLSICNSIRPIFIVILQPSIYFPVSHM